MQRKTQSMRAGFSLINIMIAIAVVAILAGALGPMLFRQIMKAKEAATVDEMENLKIAYLDFFKDTGRFPTEAEGLTVLISDPGDDQWHGPYLTGDPVAALAEFSTDAFGNDYIIDLNPDTDPAGTSDILLASSGLDQSFSAGRINSTWTLNQDDDDLIILVDSGSLNREKSLHARDELQALRNAAQAYFYDHAVFPNTLELLGGTYLNEDLHGSVFIDQWLNNYIIIVDNAANPPTMIIRSSGPDRTANSGTGDDISQSVDSIGPGRNSTIYMLNIIQGLVNTNASTDLTGDWAPDRESFNLDAAFTNDGWGNPYEEAMSSRTILSGGPDANYFTPVDNIPTGVIPDDDAGIIPWDPHGSYTIGDIVSHEGSNWECRQTHDCHGDPNWAPGIAHSLWLAV